MGSEVIMVLLSRIGSDIIITGDTCSQQFLHPVLFVALTVASSHVHGQNSIKLLRG